MPQQPEPCTQTNFSYYHEYCRLHLANVVLLSQLRALFNQRNEMTQRYRKLTRRAEDISQGQRSADDRKKRFRRTAGEIERHYRCPVESCQRSYGSEGSLNQHMKIKHPEVYHEMHPEERGEAGEWMGQSEYGSVRLE